MQTPVAIGGVYLSAVLKLTALPTETVLCKGKLCGLNERMFAFRAAQRSKESDEPCLCMPEAAEKTL
jgi:hypothetical protein